MNYLTSIRPVGLTFCAIAMGCSLAFGIWTQVNGKHRVVVASQPFFLRLICIGCFVMATSIIPLSIDDSIATTDGCSKACMAFPWLLSIGFTTTFAALFSKTWRLNKVFRNAANMRGVVVKEKDVIFPFAVLMTINSALMLSWTLVDPLVWYRTEPNEYYESHGYCRAEGNGYIAFLILIAIANASALVLATIEAFHARNIATEFSESTYILAILVSLLQAVVVGIPLLVIVHDNAVASYFVWSGIIFVVTMAILGLIFIPKVMVTRATAEPERASRTPSRYSAQATDPDTTKNMTEGLSGAGAVSEQKPAPEIVIFSTGDGVDSGNRTMMTGKF